MKCLSLKQPYANLLVFGEKTIELRKWNTKFKGEFLIHASKNIDISACERLKMDGDNLTIGVIIGSAFLYDFKEYNDQEEFNKDKQKHFSIVTKYFEGYKYGFFKNARKFKKINPLSRQIKVL